jgi:hypothetical protein
MTMVLVLGTATVVVTGMVVALVARTLDRASGSSSVPRRRP